MGEPQSVGVAGTGVMGRGLAEILAAKGCRTTLLGRSAESAERARAAIIAAADLNCRRQILSAEERAALENNLTVVADPAGLTVADLIIEAWPEDLALKQAFFAEIEPRVSTKAILASNTSALPLAEIARPLRCPERFLGLHFMNPVPASKLVEIGPLPVTAAETLAGVQELVQRLGKEYVVVKDSPGYLVNRLLLPLLAETARLLEAEAATPQDIDKALRLACGHPMGPASLADFIGLDTVLAQLRTLRETLGERFAPPPLLEKMVAAGRLGRKNNHGLLTLRKDGRPE